MHNHKFTPFIILLGAFLLVGCGVLGGATPTPLPTLVLENPNALPQASAQPSSQTALQASPQASSQAISSGVSAEFLEREYERSRQGLSTPAVSEPRP